MVQDLKKEGTPDQIFLLMPSILFNRFVMMEKAPCHLDSNSSWLATYSQLVQDMLGRLRDALKFGSVIQLKKSSFERITGDINTQIIFKPDNLCNNNGFMQFHEIPMTFTVFSLR